MALAGAAVAGGATAQPPRDREFISVCGFSHRAPDDPIVFPGLPGVSHDHTFVGNVSTNALSTPAELRRHATTCQPRADTSAYWAPTLLADGHPIVPSGSAIYYRRLTTAPVRPIPAGLRMIAGDAKSARPQSLAVTHWDCNVVKTTFYGPNGGGVTPAFAATSRIPRCPPKTELQLHVTFPECWDGRHLDSLDHRRHMAYAIGGACPPDHPVALPSISLVYSYASDPLASATYLTLSSGGVYSGHADFVNAWNERALTRLVARCLDGYAYCGG